MMTSRGVHKYGRCERCVLFREVLARPQEAPRQIGLPGCPVGQASIEDGAQPPALEQERCEDCGAELSYCGEQNEDGPTLDCRVCKQGEIIQEQYREIARLEAEREGSAALSQSKRPMTDNEATLIKCALDYDGYGEDHYSAKDAAAKFHRYTRRVFEERAAARTSEETKL
jgi:hypothetical protein